MDNETEDEGLCLVNVPEGALFTFTEWPRYRWKPHADITAYEVALCLPFLTVQHALGFDELPAEAMRHFERIDEADGN